MATLKQLAEHSKAAWGVGELLVRIANNQFAELRIARTYNGKITELEKERNALISKKRERRDELVNEMLTMLTEKRGAFVTGLKSIVYAVGQVGFRKMRPAVEIEEGYTEKGVVAKFLKRHKKYLVPEYKLDRKKLTKDYQDGKFKKIEGVEIREGEEFFISLAPRGEDTPKPIRVPLPKK